MSETVPLLPAAEPDQIQPPENGDDSVHRPNGDFTPSSSRARKWQTRSPQRIILLIALAKFTLVLSGTMIMLPLFRIIEDAFCHHYYNDTTPGLLPERECRSPGVQAAMATFFGWSALLNSIITLLVALPYGILADTAGRKVTFFISYAGLVLSFVVGPIWCYFGRDANLYYLLFGSVFLLVGGGVPVAMSALYAIAADVTTEETRAASFLYLSIAATGGGFIGPLIAGGIMKLVGPWVSIAIVFAVAPWPFVLMAFVPETLRRNTDKTGTKPPSVLLAMKAHTIDGVKQLVDALVLLKNPSIVLVMVTFFIQNPLYIAYTSILIQYVSAHFSWDIAETSYLLAPLGLLNVVVLALCPALSGLLVAPAGRFRLSAFTKDVILTRFSLFFVAAGAFLEGIGQTIFVFVLGLFIGTFGSAVSPLARALLTHYVDSEHTSRLMALITMVETIGSFFGGPILAYWFGLGHARGGIWTGLAFLYIFALCLVALIALMFVKEPKAKETEVDGQDSRTRDEEEAHRPLVDLS